MRNAGDGNAVDGKQGDHAAADIDKGAERLEMGDARIDDVSRDELHQKIFQAILLRFPTGEYGDGLIVLGFKADDLEGYGLAHACDDGNRSEGRFG